MNEAEFVKYLQETFSFSFGHGIGDDTSVVQASQQPGAQLITKDVLIENVHFSLDYFSLDQLALKSLAVNLSDIAAMGGEPQYFYLGLGFPKRLPKEDALHFFKGLAKGCKKWQVELAGGDFSASDSMFVSITAVGRADTPVYRNNAQSGDLIGITGVTGESALGLKLLQAGQREGYFVERHKSVNPELIKGIKLAPYVHAMIDVSDGILIDLKRILTASGKGAIINYDKVPVSREFTRTCKENGWNEYRLVLSGGEDYVLLFTVSPDNERLLKSTSMEYTIIGEILSEQGKLNILHRGKPVQVTQLGYDHFT